MEAKKNYVKENVEFYLPALIQLIGHENVGWNKIDSLFNRILQNRISSAKGETVLVSATIFDIIIKAKAEDKTAIALLAYFNQLFEDLSSQLKESERKLIMTILKNILKSSDYRYWDFIGELSVLSNILKTGLYTLEQVEHESANGKSTDFYLKEKSSGEFKHVEIFSIHLDSNKVVIDNLQIDKFLRYRMNQKIGSKSKDDQNKDFFLVPILRGEIKDLKIYSQFFQEIKFQIARVVEPLCFVSFSDSQGKYLHRFGRVSKIFEINLSDTERNYLDGVS